MEDLTFGEQVKIILGRKGMTIKELAETIEAKTGKRMSRQNLTQRLGRDNFQEQDMRMIARILECPFQLSIMGTETARQTAEDVPEAVRREAEVRREEYSEPQQPVQSAAQTVQETAEESVETEQPAAVTAAGPESGAAPAEPEAEEIRRETVAEAAENPAENPVETAEAEESPYSDTEVGPDERDMTIGELYDIHEELSQLEENAKAGEPVEAIKEELEKPKRDWFHGNFFLRRRKKEEKKKQAEEPVYEAEQQTAPEPETYADARETEPLQEEAYREEDYQEEASDFEPVISHNDAEEDREAGDVNPYTGKEYQSNSVRMHPTRIGYVQVYDRSIHKWTDMTEWAFLGYQERKKALLGSAYEPPIYLD